MAAADEAYRAQVRLLLDVLPIIAEEKDLALKGAAAINLFVRNLPRLSVDIDLTCLPMDGRDAALANISAALLRIRTGIDLAWPERRTTLVDQGDGLEVKLQVQRRRTQIKIEVNPSLRGHLYAVRQLTCCEEVETQFEAFVQVPVISHAELYGGKLCAALDRQHPRDLFDVYLLLSAEGIGDDVRLGLIAGLVSHNRPVAELLSGQMKDRRNAFTAQFEGMTQSPFDYGMHKQTFERMHARILSSMTAADRTFLHTFEAGEPDWNLFPEPAIQHLPAVRWKLLNIRKFRQASPVRHAEGLKNLLRVLA